MVAGARPAVKNRPGGAVVARSDGMPDSPAWRQAIDLYDKTFPDRATPILVNLPGGAGREE